MGLLGIMTIGYDEASAEEVRSRFSETFGQDIALIGATGRGSEIIGQILEQGPKASIFGDGDDKVLMLLGFDDGQVQKILGLFPKGEKPIFCGLTMENIKWTQDNLVEHLLEEKRYWESQGK